MEYFFRRDDRKLVTYFDLSRIPHGEPCSRMELAGEIRWFTRDFLRHGKLARVAWVSGGQDFFPAKYVGYTDAATAEASQSGVEVTFWYHSGMGKRAVENYEMFRKTHAISPAIGRDLADDKRFGKVPGWWEYMNPATRYLYLEILDRNDSIETVLYTLRSTVEDNGQPLPLPVAHRANATELKMFREWFERVSDR